MCKTCEENMKNNGILNMCKEIFENDIYSCLLCGNKSDEHKIFNISHDNNPIYICEDCTHKFYNELKYANSNGINGLSKLIDGVSMILNGLHDLYDIDPNDENFKDTPKRVARALLEMNYGSNEDASTDVVKISFPSGEEENGYSGLVTASNIKVAGLCPHHLLPYDMVIHLGYIPYRGRCVGLSKLCRVAKVIGKSMILQEEYTDKLADFLYNKLSSQGSIVMVEASHGCMRCRGIEMKDTTVTTCSLRGIFCNNNSLKQEWLNTIKR